MTVKQRLLEFLKTEGISASEFSRKMGLSPAYIASMRKSMPEEKVERLTKLFPQLNRDWLLYGEGNMYRDLDGDLDPHRLDRHMVPLVPTHAKAGRMSSYADGIDLDECDRVYSPSERAQLAIKVRGDSMEPKIPNGATLFVERILDKASMPWGKPLLLDTENGSVVKMLFPMDKDEDYLEARSYNKDYPPYPIPTHSILGIYRIICVVTDGDSF